MLVTQAYAVLLEDGDPLLTSRGLSQPSGATAAWEEHVLPPEGPLATKLANLDMLHKCSERMVTLLRPSRPYLDLTALQRQA